MATKDEETIATEEKEITATDVTLRIEDLPPMGEFHEEGFLTPEDPDRLEFIIRWSIQDTARRLSDHVEHHDPRHWPVTLLSDAAVALTLGDLALRLYREARFDEAQVVAYFTRMLSEKLPGDPPWWKQNRP